MRLCMMHVSIFVSRLGITDLVNKIKIYTYLIKFEINNNDTNNNKITINK